MNLHIQEFSAGIIPLFSRGCAQYDCLLIQHSNGGHWDFPKGRIEVGEEPVEAARRELLEEAGLECATILAGFSSFNYYFLERESVIRLKQVQFFAGLVNTQEITLSHEHVNYKWVPLAAAYIYLTYPASRALSDQLNQYLATSR